MAVRNDNDVDVFGLVADGGQARCGLSRRQTLAELLIFARERAIARIEQDELITGIHDRRNIRVLKSLGVDIVSAGESPHLISRCVGAIVWMQPVTNSLDIQHIGDLKLAKMDTRD